MDIASELPLIDTILAPWRARLGDDFHGYRNHVYRVVNCCFALRYCDDAEREKICIAGCFHDIGIWSANTLDYLPPSLPPMKQWLEENGREDWYDEIALMITEHHKMSPYTGVHAPLVERFRQADLVDFSLGMVRAGLDRHWLAELRRVFPNAGFHAMLARRALKWFLRHPLNPAPMMKR